MNKGNYAWTTLRIGITWILLLSCCRPDMIQWPHLSDQTTVTATAFTLASIFPRKTEAFRTINDQWTHSSPSSSVPNNNEQLLKEMKNVPLVADTATNTGSSTLTAERIEEQQSQFQQQDIVSESKDGHRDSVHLQLHSMGTATTTNTEGVASNGNDNKDKPKNGKEQPKATRVRVHTFADPASKKTWVALNTSRRKFLAFLEYNQVAGIQVTDDNSKNRIETNTISLPEEGIDSQNNNEAECKYRKEWRNLWKARQLLTDRTELLAVYQSDKGDSKGSSAPKKSRRGGFTDLLNLYTNRLVAILSDEVQDEQTPLDARHRAELTPSHLVNRHGQPIEDAESYVAHQSDHRILIKWLEENYGMSETQMLQARRFHTLPIPAQLELMHHFLKWFRSHFPYYYDRCDTCGASRKDDIASQPPPQASDNTNSGGAPVEADEDDDDDDNGTFLGYIYPSEEEVKGKASRTELYHCHKCGSFTRFPRFNSAFDIIKSKRGRCGEYSLLLYRFLRALNHDCRWVVDWADHVWAEVLIGDRNDAFGAHHHVAANGKDDARTQKLPSWIHLDPCEAAVDNPLLYQEWGKKQTYIIALYAPLRYQTLQTQYNRHNGYSPYNNNGFDGLVKASLVEDVTHQYTTDSWENICQRRDESEEEVESAIKAAVADLEQKLLKSDKLASSWSKTSC